MRRRDRAVDQAAEPTDGRSAKEGTAQRADAGAQQLRLAAQALQPALARGEISRGLDAL